VLLCKLGDIAHGQLDHYKNTGGYGLGTLATRFGVTGVDKECEWRLRYGELDGVPVEQWPPAARDYASRDASATLEVYQAIVRKFPADVLKPGPAEAYASLAYQLTHAWGVKTDATKVNALRQATTERLLAWREDLVKAGLVKVGKPHPKTGLVKYTKDTKQAKARMLGVLPDPPKTATGEVSLDEEACALSGDSLLQTYSAYGRADTFLGRVEDLANGVDFPLQCRFDTLLDSGRSSASSGKGKKKGTWSGPMRGTTIQNMGQEGGARETLTPRPGRVFVQADYARCELHAAGQYFLDTFGYSMLAKVLNSGVDIYTWFGEHAFPGAGKAGRKPSKPIVLGTPGGMGPTLLAITAQTGYGVTMTVEEAKRLRGLLLSMAPELRGHFARVAYETRNDRRATFTHPRTGYTRAGMRYSEACNWLTMQHLSAVLFKDAYTEVTRRCYSVRSSALFGSRVVVPCHDELVLETDEPLAHDAAVELGAVMDERGARWTPDCPVRAEVLVTRVWSKQAMQVKDHTGRFIPW
jgi:hypothetical protein